MSVSAISQLPFVSFQLNLAAGVGTEATIPPFSNTWQIQVLNPNVAGNPVLMQAQDLGIGAPAVPALPSPLNSVAILPTQTVTLTIGSEGNRHQIRTRVEWVAEPGANIILMFTVAIAGNARPTITYINNIGGGGQIRTGNP